jgi:hypothetical protein
VNKLILGPDSRKLFGMIKPRNEMLELILMAIALIAIGLYFCACATEYHGPHCTWICVDPTRVPDSCACAEEIAPPCGRSGKHMKTCEAQ